MGRNYRQTKQETGSLMNTDTAIDDATEVYGGETMKASAMKEVVTVDRPNRLPEITPMQMIQEAAARGNMEVVTKLMELQERWDKNQARKAFDAAMAEAKAELKPIIKNRQVDFTSQKGRTNYRYEDFAGVAEAVDPILAKHGLSYRFRTECDKDTLKVTCILAHKDGHSEENSLIGPNDTSGNKNAIQAIGSSQTYLQRYTLKAALGLAASNDDDTGGKTITGEPISKEQADKIIEALKFKNLDQAKFINWVQISCRSVKTIEDIPADYFESCLGKIKLVGASK